jgi:hypothetical protein
MDALEIIQSIAQELTPRAGILRMCSQAWEMDARTVSCIEKLAFLCHL